MSLPKSLPWGWSSLSGPNSLWAGLVYQNRPWAGSHALLKCSQKPKVQLPPALCSSYFSTYRYLCPATCDTQKSSFSPNQRLASTHYGDHKGMYPKPILHSVLSRQQLPADMKQATQTYQSSKHKDGKSGNVKAVHILKGSYVWRSPPPVKRTIHYFSDLFF